MEEILRDMPFPLFELADNAASTSPSIALRRMTPGPSGSPSFQPDRCSMPNPLLEGPISSQAGGVYLPSDGNGGGSRARMSARVGAGVGANGEGESDSMAFKMNQLFLSRVSVITVFRIKF